MKLKLIHSLLCYNSVLRVNHWFMAIKEGYMDQYSNSLVSIQARFFQIPENWLDVGSWILPDEEVESHPLNLSSSLSKELDPDHPKDTTCFTFTSVVGRGTTLDTVNLTRLKTLKTDWLDGYWLWNSCTCNQRNWAWISN